jgi:hypothetical protein
VKVRVSNRGDLPVADVQVDAYVLNPFAGTVLNPNNAIVRLRSNLATIAPGSGAPTASDPHVLECKVADPVAGPIPWTPNPADLQNSGGHLCVIANCYADGDGAVIPDTASFNIGGDQHQGQRNISLLAAVPGIRGTTLPFLVMPAPERNTETLLRVERLEVIGAGERRLLASHPAVTVVKGHEGEEELAVRGQDGKLIPIRLSRRRLGVHLAVEGCQRGEVVKLPGFTKPLPAVVSLETLHEEPPGSLHVLDIVQRAGHGLVLGGLRVLGLVTA